MYVNPFLAGILFTLMAEFALCIIAAMFKRKDD